MTSAPRSARICVANGPMMTVVRSRTRTPVRGPSLNVGAEVNGGLPDVELRRSILDYQIKIFDRGDHRHHRDNNCHARKVDSLTSLCSLWLKVCSLCARPEIAPRPPASATTRRHRARTPAVRYAPAN